jgi:hypothetical protein
MLLAVLLDLLLLGSITIIGLSIAALILNSDNRLMLLGLAFPLGAGLLTWFIFLLSWAGVPLSRVLIIGILSGCLIVVASLPQSRRMLRKVFGEFLLIMNKDEKKEWISHNYGLIMVIGLFIIACGFAVGKAYSAWDATAIWSIKGYGIAYEGSIFAGDVWGAHRLFYPLNIPILISTFRLLSGDLLPGSKLVFPIFYLSTLLIIFAFWRRCGVKSIYANFGIVLLATIPDIFKHATIGYANLPMTCYLILGALLGLDGVFQDKHNEQVMSGMLLGLAGWTRVEGVLYDLVVVLAIFVIYWISKRGKFRFFRLIIPSLLIIGIWMIFYKLYGAETSPAMRSLGSEMESITQFSLGIERIITIGRYVLKIPIDRLKWGYLFLITPLIIIINWRELHPKKDPVGLALVLSIIGTGIAACLLFYVGSVDDASGLSGWLLRSFPRAFFSTPLLAGILAILLVGTRNSPKAHKHMQSMVKS